MLVETGGVRVYTPGRSNLGATTKKESGTNRLRNLNRAIVTRTRGSRESLERLKALVVNCGVFQSIIVPVRTAKPPDNAKKGSGKCRSLFLLRNSEGSLVGFEL